MEILVKLCKHVQKREALRMIVLHTQGLALHGNKRVRLARASVPPALFVYPLDELSLKARAEVFDRLKR